MNASSIDRILLDSQKNRVIDVAGLKTYEPLFAKYRAEQQRAEQRQQRIESKEQRTAERLVEPTTQESPQSTRQHRSEPPVVTSTGLAAPSPDLSSSQPVDSPQPPGAARRKQVEKKIPQPPPPPPPSAYALAPGCYCQPRVGAAFVRRPKRRHVEASERRAELSPLGSDTLSRSDPLALSSVGPLPPRAPPPARHKDGRSAPGRFRSANSLTKAPATNLEAEDLDDIAGLPWDVVETRLAKSLSLSVIDATMQEYIDLEWDVEDVEDILWSAKAHTNSAPQRLGELKNTPRRVAPGQPAVTPAAPSSIKDQELKRRKEEKRKMMSRLAAMDRRAGPQAL